MFAQVDLTVETPEEGELWHPEVYKLAVRDLSTREVLGHIFCDFFTRPNKPHQVLRDSPYEQAALLFNCTLIPGLSFHHPRRPADERRLVPEPLRGDHAQPSPAVLAVAVSA